jgi:Domain of unknown function (DUF4129)
MPSIWVPPSWSPRQGLNPTPGQAREWLTRELHGAGYQDPWLESAIRWVFDTIGKLLDGAQRLAGLSPVFTALMALVVVALLAWVLPKVRREPGAAGPGGGVLENLAFTASHYRALAAAARHDGRHDDAVLDGFRAIARDMSGRSLLDDAPGRTAHEVSLSLASPFPDHAERLARVADLFDAVRYGHRHAGAEQAEQVRMLDGDLAGSRPQPQHLAPSVPSLAQQPV